MHDSEHCAHLQKFGALQGYCPTPTPLTLGVGFWSRGRHEGLRVPFRGRPANIQGTRTGGPIPYNPNGSRLLHGGGRQARGPADGNSPGALPESVDRTHGSRLPKGPPIGRNGPKEPGRPGGNLRCLARYSARVREVSSPVTQLTTPPRRASMARSEANPSGSDSWELERATPSWGDRVLASITI